MAAPGWPIWIEDEFDFDETEANILLDRNGLYRVKAQTQIEDFNATFGTEFSDEEYDTIGGFILAELGRIPDRGDVTSDLKEGTKLFPADPRWGDSYAKYVEEFREIFFK